MAILPALLALIGLTPGIMSLLAAPSLGALTALSVADKLTLATTVIGLLPHDAATRKKVRDVLITRGAGKAIIAKLIADGQNGHVEVVFDPDGPMGWGRYPGWRSEWRPNEIMRPAQRRPSH